MADKLSPELNEFIGELYEADYTTSQIKTILGEFDITTSYDVIRYQRPGVKEKLRKYNRRPDVKAKKKSYEKKREVKKHRREYEKEYRQRSEVKERRKEYAKEYQQRPEVKAKKKEYAKEYFQRPDVRGRRSEYRQRPDVRGRRSEYRQRLEVKERRSEYNREYVQRPEVRAKKKEYLQRLEVKERRSEYNREYVQRPEVRAKQKESEQRYAAKKRFKNIILKDLDIYIIDLFYPHPKLSVNEIARHIRNMGEKAGSEFIFTDLEKRITVALELIKENAGEDSPIIYSGDDIYEMNPSSSCWKIYEEGLESTVEE